MITLQPEKGAYYKKWINEPKEGRKELCCDALGKTSARSPSISPISSKFLIAHANFRGEKGRRKLSSIISQEAIVELDGLTMREGRWTTMMMREWLGSEIESPMKKSKWNSSIWQVQNGTYSEAAKKYRFSISKTI